MYIVHITLVQTSHKRKIITQSNKKQKQKQKQKKTKENKNKNKTKNIDINKNYNKDIKYNIKYQKRQ